MGDKYNGNINKYSSWDEAKKIKKINDCLGKYDSPKLINHKMIKEFLNLDGNLYIYKDNGNEPVGYDFYITKDLEIIELRNTYKNDELIVISEIINNCVVKISKWSDDIQDFIRDNIILNENLIKKLYEIKEA